MATITPPSGHVTAVIEVIVNGELDVWTAPRVSDDLAAALATNPQRLVIDLANCPTIDAAGILLLLDVHRRAMRLGGVVVLRGPSVRLRRKLQLAHVERVLQVIPADASAGGGEADR